MTTADEARPLIREGPTVVMQGYSSNAVKNPLPASDLKITLKGVVGIFFAAIIVFALAAITSRTIPWGGNSASSNSETDESASSRLTADQALYGVPSTHGLVKPFNGTHPTRTSTEDCTGAGRLPPILAVICSIRAHVQQCLLLVCVWLPLSAFGT